MKRIIIVLFSILLFAVTGCHKDKNIVSGQSSNGSLDTTIPDFGHYPSDTVKYDVVLFPSDARSIVDNEEHTITVEGNVAHIGYSGTLKAGMTIAYPKSMFTSAKDGKAHVKFPEVQEYKVGADGRQILDFPRYGVVGSDNTVTLYNSSSLQKISIKNSQLVEISVDEVVFYITGDHDGCLWGEADIDATNSTAITGSKLTGGGKSIKMRPSGFVIQPGETRDLYFCVPNPGSGLYFNIFFTESDMEECTLVYNGPGSNFNTNYLVREEIDVDTHNCEILRVRPSELDKMSGDGSKYNPYLIYSADDLYSLSTNIQADGQNLYVVQMNDIDFSSKTVSGNSILGNVRELHYSGNGHVLSGTSASLAAFAGEGSFISDLFFEAGGRPLIRKVEGTHLKNVRVRGNRTNLDNETVLGGIVDTLYFSRFQDCASYVSISMQRDTEPSAFTVGGMAGIAVGSYQPIGKCEVYDGGFYGEINLADSNTQGNCICTDAKVGGIFGSYTDGYLYLSLCDVDGKIEVASKENSGSTLWVGGCVGYCDCPKADIDRVNTHGSVRADGSSVTYIGGLFGYYRVTDSGDMYGPTVYAEIMSYDSTDHLHIGGMIGYACGTRNILKIHRASVCSDASIYGKGFQEVYAGGFIGTVLDNPDYIVVQIVSSRNLAKVMAQSVDNQEFYRMAGGFIGYCKFSNDSYKEAASFICNCENAGEIYCQAPYGDSHAYRGGFIGWQYENETYIVNCLNRHRINDHPDGFGLIGSMSGSGGHVLYGGGNTHGTRGGDHPAIGWGGVVDGNHITYSLDADLATIPDNVVNSLNNWVDNIHSFTKDGWFTYTLDSKYNWTSNGLDGI